MQEMLHRILKALRGPTLLAGAVYALAGGGFFVTTIVLARTLDTAGFAEAMIIIAICNVSLSVAPSGVDGVVLRHELRADRRLFQVTLFTAFVVATCAALIGLLVYDIGLHGALSLGAAAAAGGTGLAVKSSLQREHFFLRSMLLSQSANIGLLVASILMWFGYARTAYFPTLVVSLWFLLVSMLAWSWALTRPHTGQPIGLHLWRDGINFIGVMLATTTLFQMERLVIPLVLSDQDLAVFAIVAAYVLAPYRMLEMGTLSTLTARVRSAASNLERRSLLEREMRTLVPLAIVGGLALTILSHWVYPIMLGRDESVPYGLVVVVVISGIIRVLAALAHSTAAAVCTSQELKLMNANSWLAVLVGAAAGAILSRWGLAWLVVGVALGWLCRMLLATLVATRHLRSTAA